jgi:HemY protein
MWTEARDNDAALGAIARLQAAGARHMHALRIALNANLQAGRWQDALKVVRVLEKRRALHPVLARRLKLAAYRERLEAQRFDPASLELAWNEIPAADRENPDIALAGARLLNLAGRGGLAAAAIEAALGTSPADWDDSAGRLLEEYARAQAFPARTQLERVEAWIEKAPPETAVHAALLRAGGLLCLREQIWGKAASYLKESLQIAPEAGTLLALARLAEAVGDEVQATAQFREAALAYARQGATEIADATLRTQLDQEP